MKFTWYFSNQSRDKWFGAHFKCDFIIHLSEFLSDTRYNITNSAIQ